GRVQNADIAGQQRPALAVYLDVARCKRRRGGAQITLRKLHGKRLDAHPVIVAAVGNDAALRRDVRQILRDDGFLFLVLRVGEGDDYLVNRLAPQLAAELGDPRIVGRELRQAGDGIVGTDQLERQKPGARADEQRRLDVVDHLGDESLD